MAKNQAPKGQLRPAATNPRASICASEFLKEYVHVLKKSYKRIIAHARPRLQTKRSCAVLQPRTANATTLKAYIILQGVWVASPFSLSHLFTFQKPEGELLGKQAVYAQGVYCGWSEPLTCGLSIRTRSLVLCRNTRTRTRIRARTRAHAQMGVHCILILI